MRVCLSENLLLFSKKLFYKLPKCMFKFTKKNLSIKNTYNQVDITATIAELLSIEMPFAQGKSIDELFVED